LFCVEWDDKRELSQPMKLAVYRSAL